MGLPPERIRDRMVLIGGLSSPQRGIQGLLWGRLDSIGPDHKQSWVGLMRSLLVQDLD